MARLMIGLKLLITLVYNGALWREGIIVYKDISHSSNIKPQNNM